MKKIINLLNKKSIIFTVIIILFILLIISVLVNFYVYDNFKNASLCEEKTIVVTEEPEKTEIYFVDLKGAIKNPGVYQVTSDMLINDAIKLAGGFKSNAYSKNINLSKKVKDEMVIYVYTKNEYGKLKKSEAEINKEIEITDEINSGNSIIEANGNVTSSEEKNSNPGKTIININTATKEEFLTLAGIGETKALDIIEYRNSHGYFKSIEELKMVNGIGNSTFEKIKMYLTI